MQTILGILKNTIGIDVQKAKIQRRLWYALAGFLILQIYFVRELLAAELLFAIVFALFAMLALVFYFVGLIGERGVDLAEAGARFMAPLVRRSFASLEDFSKRPYRHPRSESAQ
jgi:hypothetical protein